MAEPIKVMIVDDHLIVREGITSILDIVNEIQVVGQASSAEEALAKIPMVNPDIILVDLRMPGTDGIQLTRMITRMFPDCKVIVLTLYDQYVSESTKAGAKGYLLKDIHLEDLVDAIKRVDAGETVFDQNIRQMIGIDYEDDTEEDQDDLSDKSDTDILDEVRIYNQLRVLILPPATISGSLSLTSIVEEAVGGEFKQVEGTISDGFAITFDLIKPSTPKEINERISRIPDIILPTEDNLAENNDTRDIINKQRVFNAKHPMIMTVFVQLQD